MRLANKTTGMARWVAAGVLAMGLAAPQIAAANHPVKVEGDTDVDGDGRTGQAEDTDGPTGDPLGLTFGTIAGCLGAMNGGINQNGVCLIASSGSFVETVNITGQVTLEAAPGVTANIEAFLVPADPRLQQFPGAAANPNGAQGQPGIVINAPANRTVTLRNLTITNWIDGIVIMGSSHVIMDNVNVDHNVNSGISVRDSSVVGIRNSQITSTGFRQNGMTGDFPMAMMPNPGIALVVTGNQTTVQVQDSTIAGTFGQPTMGVNVNGAGNRNMLFDNNRRANLPMNGPMMPMTPR